MPFELLPLQRDDSLEVAKLFAESYKNNPFRNIIWPNGMPQDSIDAAVNARANAVDDPDRFALKVVDTDTGEMAGVAVWQYTKPLNDEDWAREKREAMNAYPGARKDILEPLLMDEQDTVSVIPFYLLPSSASC